MPRAFPIPLCLVVATALPPPALAQWIENGVPVCGSACIAGAQRVIPDGVGGVYVAWRDSRDYPTTDEISTPSG